MFNVQGRIVEYNKPTYYRLLRNIDFNIINWSNAFKMADYLLFSPHKTFRNISCLTNVG